MSTSPIFIKEVAAICKILGVQPEEKTLSAAVHRVMETPLCAITGNSDDVKDNYIRTPFITEAVNKLPSNIRIKVSREGLIKIIESLMEHANTTPMTGEQIYAHIQDMRKYGRNQDDKPWMAS